MATRWGLWRAGAVTVVVLGAAACSGSDRGLSDDEAGDLRDMCVAVSANAERCSALMDRIADIVSDSTCASDQAASLLAGAIEDPSEDYRDTSEILLDCDL